MIRMNSATESCSHQSPSGLRDELLLQHKHTERCAQQLADNSKKRKKMQTDSFPLLLRTLKSDTHSESELIIVLGNGRRAPIYRRFIGWKSSGTAYQLAKVTPLQFNAKKQRLLRRWSVGRRGLKQMAFICSDIILLALNHLGFDRKSILISPL